MQHLASKLSEPHAHIRDWHFISHGPLQRKLEITRAHANNPVVACDAQSPKSTADYHLHGTSAQMEIASGESVCDAHLRVRRYQATRREVLRTS
jgi:hypothetical protein